jgi:hypothetical protein
MIHLSSLLCIIDNYHAIESCQIYLASEGKGEAAVVGTEEG